MTTTGRASKRGLEDRVRIDSGKVWKVVEFKVEIFQVWKTIENDLRHGKVMESVTANLEN